jgi:hypothetical protein
MHVDTEIDRELDRLMIRTCQVPRSMVGGIYKQAHEKAIAAANDCSIFSRNWWHYRRRARWFKRCSD